jgi:hypothetical protein
MKLSLPLPSSLMPDVFSFFLMGMPGLVLACVIVVSSFSSPDKEDIQTVVDSAPVRMSRPATMPDADAFEASLARFHEDALFSESINNPKLSWVDGLKSVVCQPEKLARPEGFFTNCALTFAPGSLLHDMVLPVKTKDPPALAGLAFRFSAPAGKQTVEVAVAHPEKISRIDADRAMFVLFWEVKNYLAHYQSDSDVVPKEALDSWRTP